MRHFSWFDGESIKHFTFEHKANYLKSIRDDSIDVAFLNNEDWQHLNNLQSDLRKIKKFYYSLPQAEDVNNVKVISNYLSFDGQQLHTMSKNDLLDLLISSERKEDYELCAEIRDEIKLR